ncbi:MAG: hypothetical protein WAL90_14195 [Desulfobacterales bacterium]
MKIATIKTTFVLEKDKNGTSHILWHGIQDGKPVVFDTNPTLVTGGDSVSA